MKRILLILAILAPVLALAAPARAGGWAVTYMDPAPADMRPHTTYTLGFWLLQHGTHPYEGDDLGEVGLKFTDGKRTVGFPGVELREPSHYAAAISLPPGTWKVEGVQGWFAPYAIGTLSVPGSLKVDPIPKDLQRAIDDQAPQKDHWGEIHPPGFPAGTASPSPSTSPAASPAASPAVSPSAGAAGAPGTTTVAVVEPDSWWRPPYTVAAVLALVALGVVAHRVRRR
ncbi:hypothetical protein [Streptosporangium roseum]|uniref:Uncharacterized protein n=1 Tax=Streptosporangium roseum (strain ATCC 12428 / DSM 43021 / JCM 3005 / KCTC 9067 / NCIMB 10171 / NRRL 2505 / NI 9100) TaxID=479432 RepID=D2BFP9_STRRD|nr:hypothetical protein [Streptosporangium roseum]ACZ90210.1 hypothetical protein Sros_7529 [Streptosporangium roseum DSM 43021]